MNRNAKNMLNETISYISGAYAPSTIRAYKGNFEKFINYCDSANSRALPADSGIICGYIKKLVESNLKPASIRLAIASISAIHKFNQLLDPTIFPDAKLELRRMHRALGRRSKQALGITADILEEFIKNTKNDLRGIRDKALLLLAYDLLCRRSELVSLRLEDLDFDKNGLPLRIRLRKSKTDQEAIGKIIRLTEKSQVAILSWINISKITEGYIFRSIKGNGNMSLELSPGQVNRIYKKLALEANLPKEQIQYISSHSPRVGAAQDLATQGESLPNLMERGRWTKPETAIRYIDGIHKFTK
jgi:integrase